MLVLKSKRVEGFVCSDHAKRGSHMKIEAPSGKVVLVLVMLDEPPDINSAVTHAEIARRLESKHGLVSRCRRRSRARASNVCGGCRHKSVNCYAKHPSMVRSQ